MTDPVAEIQRSLEALRGKLHASGSFTDPYISAAWSTIESALARLQQAEAERDTANSRLASLADTVGEAIRNTCSMPHPYIGLDSDLRPLVWQLSFEANAQKRRADAAEAAMHPMMSADGGKDIPL